MEELEAPSRSEMMGVDTESEIGSSENISQQNKENDGEYTEETTYSNVTTEEETSNGNAIITNKMNAGQDEPIESEEEAMHKIGYDDSTADDDIYITKKVDTHRYKGRSTSINDLVQPYGELDIGQMGAAEFDEFGPKLQTLEDTKRKLEENRELLVASGMLGRRANPQYDLGGDTGYKSSLFEPRF